MRFVDTNILIYAVSENPVESDKQQTALRLLDAGDLTLSVQVLQEFYYQATHPRRKGALSHHMALSFIDSLSKFPVLDINVNLFREAVATSHRFRLSYWDGAILAAARAAGCDAVYSEDLSAEQDYDGLRVINPFRGRTRAR